MGTMPLSVVDTGIFTLGERGKAAAAINDKIGMIKVDAGVNHPGGVTRAWHWPAHSRDAPWRCLRIWCFTTAVTATAARAFSGWSRIHMNDAVRRQALHHGVMTKSALRLRAGHANGEAFNGMLVDVFQGSITASHGIGPSEQPFGAPHHIGLG